MTQVVHVPAIGSMPPALAIGEDGAAAGDVTAKSTTPEATRARIAASLVPPDAADKIQ